MPATYCVAWARFCAFWASSCWRPTTLIDCGVSISGVLVLRAVTERLATKPSTGPFGFSAWPGPGWPEATGP